MPRRRKKTKSREEKSAEEFFPLDIDDVDRAIQKVEKRLESNPEIFTRAKEIIAKPTESITKSDLAKKVIEKVYKKPDRKSLEITEILGIDLGKQKPKSKKTYKKREKRKKQGKKPKSKFSKKTSSKNSRTYKIPKIKLKPDGYELIITEKPQAALKISSALGNSIKRNFNGVPYYDVSRNGKQIVVGCAVGHLFTLNQKPSATSNQIPIFDIGWVPNYYVRKSDFSKKYFDLLLRLSKNAKSITIATDYDVEGEVIGMNAMRFIAGQQDASRMKFSTLTNNELNKAYENKYKTINWGQAIAGETRHYLDWFYGINLSRALMNAIKTTGSFKIMSIGRVQGPALNLIVKREREIKSFKSKPYWQIFITVLDSNSNKNVELKHNKDIFDKNLLSNFEELKGKNADLSTKKTQEFLKPNPPFNLTTLQTEAYKLYGITPSNTLKAAQSLYLSGLISYPRTSSQKLPASIGYDEILKKLSKKYKVEHLTTKKTPIEGPKLDLAHPSIYPTLEDPPVLTGDEEKIYNLIVKRFISLFCEDAIIDNKKITAETKLKLGKEAIFYARGSQIKKKNWLEIYPHKLKEQEIPDLNGEHEIKNSRIEEKETQPPKRYSPASIISELEKRNLGTKATRASILETLYNRGYIKEKSIEATPLGISLIETLEKHSPIIIDENLTKHFEEEMETITESESEFKEKEEKVINEAKSAITNISKDFEKDEKEIGKELLKAQTELREIEKKENTLTQCPVCKSGNLAITYSRKTRRHFIACNAYPKCTNTYSLPPQELIKKTDPLKLCPDCNFPQLMSIRKGKKPWIFCFNPQCPSNKERIEEYYKRKEAEAKTQ